MNISVPALGEVQVWAIEITKPPLALEELRRFLTREEKQQIERFREAEDRRRSVVSRGVTRWLLGAMLDRDPPDLAIVHTDRGKPFLRPVVHAAPHFNASHSGNWVLIAFSQAGPVGVDVERVRPVSDLNAIAQRYFARSEAEALASKPAPERLEAFFRCWARKEAFLKAVGTGIGAPLDDFVVNIDEQGPALLTVRGQADLAAQWTLLNAAPAPGYVGAAAVSAPGQRLTWCHFPENTFARSNGGSCAAFSA